jgi:anti-sigma B factor antagonist
MQEYEPVLRIMERTEGDGAVLTVQGEVDLATLETLGSRLADVCARHHAVTIDLRRVTFLDCLGLRLLIDRYEEAAACGCHVDFVQGPPGVERVFELTGTLAMLPFVEVGRAPLSAVASA